MTKVGKISFADDIIKEYEAKAKKALVLTGKVLMDEIREAQVVPRDLGTLQNEKFYLDDSTINKNYVSLVFEGPYARRLYFHPEYNFQRESWVDEQGRQHGGNVNAQAYWFVPWQPGGKYQHRPHEIFKALLEKEL